VEPGTVPAAAVPMGWSTYTAAAGEAGLSREFGGIHFRDADAHGLNLGRAVGTNTWNKAQTYFQGIAAGSTATGRRPSDGTGGPQQGITD
jgi:hypothetical protein